MEVLVHGGIGIGLAARRLNVCKFIWTNDGSSTLGQTPPMLDALVLRLPWQRFASVQLIDRQERVADALY